MRLLTPTMNRFIRLTTLFVAGLLLLAALACGAAATPTMPGAGTPQDAATPVKTSRAEILGSLTSRVILPGYTEVSGSLAQWEQSVDVLCSSPGDAELEAARRDWRTARGAWLRTESFRFGPAMERRSASLVDWWPIDAAKIDGRLAEGEAITQERVSQYLPATQRGLSAAEYLLFGPGSGALAQESGGELRCAYLRAVAAVARDEADGILATWKGRGGEPGYAGYYDGTSQVSLLDREAVAVAIRSLVFQVRAIANMRLAPALGLDGPPDAGAIPAGDAQNTRRDLLSQLDGIARIYRGAEGGLGLSDRVHPLSPETDARMLAAIEAAVAAVGDLDGNIIAQLEANPTQVMAAYDRIKDMQRVLNTEIVSLLGVSVGFADTDGDS